MKLLGGFMRLLQVSEVEGFESNYRFESSNPLFGVMLNY